MLYVFDDNLFVIHFFYSPTNYLSFSCLLLEIKIIALFDSELYSKFAATVFFLITSNSAAKYCRASLATNGKNKTPAATAFHLKTRTFIVIAPLHARRCKVVTYSRKIISRRQVGLGSITFTSKSTVWSRISNIQVHYISSTKKKLKLI